MSGLEQAARMALDTLERLQGGCTDSGDGTVEAITVWCPEVIDALRAALDAGQAQPVAWVCAIDEAMVTHHIGTAEPSDDYETAKRKLNSLLCHAQSIGEYFAKQAALYASPPARQPLTDEQITAAARVLNKRNADACGVNEDDSWALYCDDFKADARAALQAAHGIGATP